MGDSLDSSTAIAIIGAAGRYPGARTLREFWQNLRGGAESVRRFTNEELLAAGESPAVLADPDYVRSWPVLDDLETFDAAFFGMSPRDAAVMDPQHRFFLEVAWEAMEDAGYDPENTGGPVGVFAACGQNTYMMHHLVTNPEVMDTVGEWLVRHTGNDMNFLATRVSYQMNLKGPSLNVQTACSSSLVAVHLACQSLQNGECDMALAGASTMLFPQNRGYLWKQGEIMSKEGHCRPFDARSDGTIFGSGTGCVILKRLSDAIRDGDVIRGVIRGSAINNDGSTKVGYLAPSVEGQASAIEEAIGVSGVEADTISYLEAHGTATAIGDPIEVAALAQAFRSYTDRKQFCAIGSVKANIGHLGEAAGMASLAKVLLSMEHREIPPSINFERPSPEIDFAGSPVFVNTRLTPWKSEGPRRAGITSLGAGGTNAHVIVEEPPPPEPSGPSRRFQVLVWSAKTEAALESLTERLRDFLREEPGVNLADLAYTLQTGRKQHGYRRTLVCETPADAVAALSAMDPKRVFTHQAGRAASSIVFMFPGGGAQYAGAGVELYRTEPAYRAAFDECLAAFEPEVTRALRRLLLSTPPGDEAASAELERPALSVSAVFVIEYAMAKLLQSWGCQPAAMIGHSMGEYVAACFAEVMTLKEAADLLMLRGRIFERVPPGGMLSVQLPEGELLPLLGPELSVAAVNAPGLCVASGPIAAIEALEKALGERDVECSRVHIAVAAHSAMLDSSLGEFERQCRTIRLSPPKIPFMSNLTGTWIKPGEATDPMYWVRHLRSAVRFSDGIAEVLRGSSRILLEVGPGRTLSSLARQQPGEVTALPTLRHPREVMSDVAFMLQTIGRLWLHGTRPSWARFYAAERRRRVSAPTYPFERHRFWIERGEAAGRIAKPRQASQLRKKPDVADWFYVPSWKRSIPKAPLAAAQRYLVFCDEAKVGERLAARLSPEAVRVTLGYEFVRLSDTEYIVRPSNPVDYVALLEALRATKRFPDQIVHCWPVVGRGLHWSSIGLGLPSTSLSRFDKTRERCFDSLMLLARALDEGEEPVTLTVVSDDLFSFGREAARHPARALLSGPARVIPREMPQIRTRHVDIGLGGGRRELERTFEALAREIETPPSDPVVLYRGGERWIRTHEPARVEPTSPGTLSIRPSGTYVITGGLGGIGLAVAEHFARTAHAKLVLIGRSPVPPAAEWDAWIARHGDGDRTSQRIRKIRNIIALGGEVLALSADVADREQMAGALSIARERFGQIHGAIHAAGVIDDGLIALKTPESAAAVIGAKAKGALVLESLIAKDEPDFLLLFSSVSSILGLEGQIDYTAANAFLDALADAESHTSKTRIVSINWNAWAEVGMAVAIADKAPQQSAPASVRSGPHPLLHRVAYETKNETRITTSFSRAQQWLLSEHVVRGAEALIPGTGYLEIMRAAFELHGEDRAVELRDVFFLSPFAVRVGESRALTVQLNHAGSSAEVSIFSERHDAPHVTGRIAYVDPPPPRHEDLQAVAARCTVQVKELGGFLDQSFMDFGPRWGNMQRVHIGDKEALVELELPAPYVDDLLTYRLHPALLDMATGGAQSIVPGFDRERDFYVPFNYGKLLLRRGLPAKAWSHVRFNPTGAKDLIAFDVTLYDDAGDEVASISRFMMKRVDLAAVLRSDASRAETSPSNVTRIGAVVHQGIQAAEGMEVLDRILTTPVGSRIVACSVDLDEWASVVDAEAMARSPSADAGPESQASTAFARPTLANAYVAPRDDVERDLATLWRELLGVEKVGIHDDFFELGGQSLIAVRLFNKVRKKYGVDLPISTLFEAPNIAGCAVIIRADAGIPFSPDAAPEAAAHANGAPEPNGAAHPLTPPSPGGVAISNGTQNGHDDGEAAPESVRSGARKPRWKSLVPMQRKGTELPFYIVAGMGGTLNNLRAVALLMGDKRPVYGLQPPGADGEQKRLYHVEDLAEHYIRQIRTVQPHGPYLLGGYSGGGVAAFEMSRQLEEQGEKVLFLGFLDTFSPHLPLRPLVDRMKIHLRRVKNYGPGYLMDTGYRRLYSEARNLQMKTRRQLGRVFQEKYRYEALQDSWVVAESRYQPGTWDGKAVLFRAREESALSRWTAVEVDEQHGWGRFVKGGVEVVICPGDHQTMCEDPYVRTLAQKLREAIDRATAHEVAPESPPVSAGRKAPSSSHAPASGR